MARKVRAGGWTEAIESRVQVEISSGPFGAQVPFEESDGAHGGRLTSSLSRNHEVEEPEAGSRGGAEAAETKGEKAA